MLPIVGHAVSSKFNFGRIIYCVRNPSVRTIFGMVAYPWTQVFSVDVCQWCSRTREYIRLAVQTHGRN